MLGVLQGSEYAPGLVFGVWCSNFTGLLLLIHVQMLFNSFANFDRIYFRAALAGCFLEQAGP